jgi:hypothetical protein
MHRPLEIWLGSTVTKTKNTRLLTLIAKRIYQLATGNPYQAQYELYYRDTIAR